MRRQGYANAYAGIMLPNPASVDCTNRWDLFRWACSRASGSSSISHDVACCNSGSWRSALGDPRPTKGLFQEEGVTAMLARLAQSIASP